MPLRGCCSTTRSGETAWHHGGVPETRHVDLCIIGSGSANSIPDERFDDWSIALVEGGTFGGTCLNVGCIPTKMYVHPADLARTPEHAGPLGVDLTLDRVRWGEIRDRIFGRIDPISAAGERYRAESRNISLFRPARPLRRRLPPAARRRHRDHRGPVRDRGRFPGPDPDDRGAGRHPVRDLRHRDAAAGAAPVDDHRRRRVRGRGVRPRVLRVRDRGHRGGSERRAPATRGRRDLVPLHRAPWASGSSCGSSTRSRAARRTADGGVSLDVEGPGGPTTLTADVLLLATGRIPNGDRLDLDRTGVTVDDAGYVIVDEHQQTRAPASSPSATSAPTTSSSTSPTTRPGSSSTTCCTRTR